jgi:hypothetical protein
MLLCVLARTFVSSIEYYLQVYPTTLLKDVAVGLFDASSHLNFAGRKRNFEILN